MKSPLADKYYPCASMRRDKMISRRAYPVPEINMSKCLKSIANQPIMCVQRKSFRYIFGQGQKQRK